MKKYSNFAIKEIIQNSLYAVEYNNTGFDEFCNIFEKWSDTEYLETFFENHKSDLESGFFDTDTIENAIFRTLEEAKKLETLLVEIAEKGKSDTLNCLQSLFKPLNKSENTKFPIPDFQKSKTYGSNHKSWLRVYAIRIDSNVYIITGGTIKLTQTMNEREHLKDELNKLNLVKQFLIDNDIIDNDSIIDFMEI
jgi:hypothetical protein